MTQTLKQSPALLFQTPKKIFFYHFGCRLNKLETLNIENNASAPGSGFINAQSVQEADYVIINTCTVTNRADTKNRGAIRQAHKLNPRARIVVTGCYATTDAGDIRKMDGVFLVLPNSQKSSIPEILESIESHEEPPSRARNGLLEETNQETPDVTKLLFRSYPQSLEKLSRAYVKIQDGCAKRCSYCKIPAARGKPVSRPFDDIAREVISLSASGFGEIILTGINIGSYKTDGVKDFGALLAKLVEIPGDFYYRISSLEPESLSPEIIKLAGHSKIAPFFHIPLQSASPAVLRNMNRRSDLNNIFAKFEALRNVRPDIHIGTDLIVGFPGESEEDFLATKDFIQKAGFANVHLFPFSRRTGTPADTKIINKELTPVHGAEIKRRAAALNECARNSARLYVQNTVQKPYRAIVEKVERIEKPQDPGNAEETFYRVSLTTENFMKCIYSAPEKSFNLKKGQMINIMYDEQLTAKIVEKEVFV